jgi:hypothetical protein
MDERKDGRASSGLESYKARIVKRMEVAELLHEQNGQQLDHEIPTSAFSVDGLEIC